MNGMQPGERARYDAFASWYEDWVAAPEDDLVAASLFEMIGRVKSKRSAFSTSVVARAASRVR